LFGIEFNLVPDAGVVKLGPGDKGVAVSVGIGEGDGGREAIGYRLE
jgi:hypothetical protein